MVRPIVHDPFFLSLQSESATTEDLSVAQDLEDTLLAHQEHCVGMAANMIGVRKRIIAFFQGNECTLMLNPEIISQSEPYEAEEGCLSLEGKRTTIRYKKIKVRYQNRAFQTRLKTFTGWPAQIIQHELDHCNGILI